MPTWRSGPQAATPPPSKRLLDTEGGLRADGQERDERTGLNREGCYAEFTAQKLGRNCARTGSAAMIAPVARPVEAGLPGAAPGQQPAAADPGQGAGRPVELLLREDQGAGLHFARDPGQSGHGLHRALRLRQEHVPAHAQPHERHRAGHPRGRHRGARRPEHLRAGHRCRGPASSGGHGVPEVQPLPEIHLRERRLRPAHQRHGGQPARSRGTGRAEPAGRRALDGGEGPAARLGAGACRADSSSGSALRGRWPFAPRSC